MDVSVLGTGYVGLIQAAALTEIGHRALLHTAEHAGMPLKLRRSVTDVNDHQRHILFSKLKAQFPAGLAGKSIAVWGLALKPNTDDIREAPSRYPMETLWAEGAIVQAYDPEAMSECRRIYGYRDDLHLCATRNDTLEDADALVICTEWKNFRVVDFDRLASKLRHRSGRFPAVYRTGCGTGAFRCLVPH